MFCQDWFKLIENDNDNENNFDTSEFKKTGSQDLVAWYHHENAMETRNADQCHSSNNSA